MVRDKIFDKIKNANKIALFSHILPDGDSVGSTLAMLRVLRQAGKEAAAFIDGKIPHRLEFFTKIAGEGCLDEFNGREYDLLISVDCGDSERTGKFRDAFDAHVNTVCIDHHFSNTGFAGENLVVPDASSAGEVLYGLFKEWGFEIDGITASLLYGAIASDSGCFMFSNTSPKTHIYAAELMAAGADYARINKLLFGTMEPEAVKIRGYAMNNLEYYCGGKVAAIVLTEEKLRELGVKDEHTEGLTDIPRNVEGVEAGMVIREREGSAKVSLRTNELIDASYVMGCFGGGGHRRASGCVTDGDVYTVRDRVVKIIEDLLNGKD